jgi:flagellar hook-associated protein 2
MSSSLPTINFGGLASGLDTNKIVDQLMSIERQPLTRLQQRQTLEEARMRAFSDVRSRLTSLASATADLRDAGAWADVQSVESSDTTRVAATRTGGAAAGGYEITVTQLARAYQITQQSSATAASADDTLHLAIGAGSTINVVILSGDSLETIAGKINGSSGIGVYASIVSSKLVLSGKATGSAASIAVTSDGALAADLNFNTGSPTIGGQNASFTVNGSPKTSSSNTVTDAIAGLSLTLKAQTASALTVTVGAPAPSTDAIQAKVRAFVDQYNSTLDFIRGKLNERKVAAPKTDSERAQGALRGDLFLTRLLSKLRGSVADGFTGRPPAASQLSQIGVSTGAGTGSTTINQDAVAGRLTLDNAKLADQLSTRFSDVKALFTNATGAYATEGLSQRLDEAITPYTAAGGVLASRVSSEQSLIDSLKDSQSKLAVRLTDREKALRVRFTMLETTLSQLQSQGASLTAQLGTAGK